MKEIDKLEFSGLYINQMSKAIEIILVTQLNCLFANEFIVKR